MGRSNYRKENRITNYQMPRSKVILEKLIVTQLMKKFNTFYGICRFMAVFRTVRHWSVS